MTASTANMRPVPGATSVAARTVLIGGLAALGIGAYVSMRPEQPWILVLATLMVALGTDGLVKSHPHWIALRPIDSIAYTFLPALAVLGSGLFIDHAIDSYARQGAALAAGLTVGLAAFGEFQTVDPQGRLYGPFRVFMAVATYLVAFSFFTVIYSRDFDVPFAGMFVAGVSALLAMELLRESRIIGMSSLLVGLAIGLTLGEFRLALYFFPLDGLLAGALLLIAFYLATGIVHHLLDRDLDVMTAAEYVVVAGIASAAVVVARVAS
ncbi:MAG: hypothetical protein AB7N24_07275 [Dehalococcoidia bacterium]